MLSPGASSGRDGMYQPLMTSRRKPLARSRSRWVRLKSAERIATTPRPCSSCRASRDSASLPCGVAMRRLLPGLCGARAIYRFWCRIGHRLLSCIIYRFLCLDKNRPCAVHTHSACGPSGVHPSSATARLGRRRTARDVSHGCLDRRNPRDRRRWCDVDGGRVANSSRAQRRCIPRCGHRGRRRRGRHHPPVR